MKVDGKVHEGRVINEAEACPPLWHFAPEQQFFVNLHAKVVGMKHSGVPQAVDHDSDVVVELADCLLADAKGLLQSIIKTDEKRKV